MCKVTFKKANGEVEMRDYSPPPASARPGLKPLSVGIPRTNTPSNFVCSARTIKMGTGRKG